MRTATSDGLGPLPNPRVDRPMIAVEYVSTGKRYRCRDYVKKHDEDSKAGVLENWEMDRFRRTMTAFRGQRGMSAGLVVNSTETYGTQISPSLELPVLRLLTPADLQEKSQ
jgi:hypothetical protein